MKLHSFLLITHTWHLRRVTITPVGSPGAVSFPHQLHRLRNIVFSVQRRSKACHKLSSYSVPFLAISVAAGSEKVL